MLQIANIILCCILLATTVAFYCHCISTDDMLSSNYTNLNSRKRRHLVFPKGARNGIRFNFKINRVTPVTNILAYSDGMRIQWDLPTEPKHLRPMIGRRHAEKREVLETIETILSGHGFDGEACIRRVLCETSSLDTPATGLIRKILHKIFSVSKQEREHADGSQYWLYSDMNGIVSDTDVCVTRFAHRCPFSLLTPSFATPLAPHHEIRPRD